MVSGDEVGDCSNNKAPSTDETCGFDHSLRGVGSVGHGSVVGTVRCDLCLPTCVLGSYM